MADVVVTVPKNFWDWSSEHSNLRGLAAWIAEGDAAGSTVWSGTEWHFELGGPQPKINPGERVYVVCEGKLRGYAPLMYIDDLGGGRYALVRGGGAVAVTIDESIRGFRGFRYRWWNRENERPFPDWKTP
jgi:hypothetical protein